MASGDDYVLLTLNLLYGSIDAVKVSTEDDRILWIPRSVMFGPHETEIGVGSLPGDEEDIKVRRWFASKESLL